MSRLRRRFRRIAAIAAMVMATLLLGGTVTVILMVRGSLPVLDGERPLAGLDGVVTVTRDSLGIPDLSAASRVDAARALGYLHAQDRFFQMDLQRRGAAGELSELMGPATLRVDREARVHRFRHRAAQVLDQLPAGHRELLHAYTDGVNAGLDDLRARPPEYFALRQHPEPWRPEDSILTIHAMFLDLSLSAATYEKMLTAVRDNLPPALVELLLPWSNPWDAPLVAGEVDGITIPDSTLVDVRDWSFGEKSWSQIHEDLTGAERPAVAGSNNWAVSGARSTHESAIVANDMHLPHRLPNIWYRARMTWPEGDGRRSVVGLTLPGTPAVIAGSNGDVAWGFTNSAGDWADLAVLETDSADATRYRTPDGWKRFARVAEIIEVAGSAADTLWIEETVWGPVWSTDTRGRQLALRWTAHDASAVNFEPLEMETISRVEDVVAVAGGFGIPAQNLVCGDREGHIAWVVAGRIPRRVGWDGRTSVSWADGTQRWDGYLSPDENPRVLNPPDGQLWTANNRVSAGRDLALIGEGGYSLGARARQIRDDLSALGDAITEAELLEIALDDRALMLESWRSLALEVLERSPPDSLRATFERVVRSDWSGRAEPSSVSYRLMRSFAFACIENVYDLLTGAVQQIDDTFRPGWLPYRHAVTRELIAARPAHLLAPWFEDWDALVLDAVDEAMATALQGGRHLEDYTWGASNVPEVEHPMVFVDARLARWLAAPRRPAPGDSFMPRVQRPRHGASERMVVAPGHEDSGILHMPGGQSGHPWSPYFLAGHEAWVEGQPTPLLPGEAAHELRLVPATPAR